MLLYLTLLLPLLGGAVLPLFRFDSVKKRGIYVEAVVLATSVLTWILLLTRTEARFTLLHLYHVEGALDLSFRVDGMACVFAGLVSLLWPIASLYAFEYMKHEERPNTFFCFYTMSYAVTLAVALSANLFTLYIFYECLTLITLPLVVHKQDAKSILAGRKYLTFSISGAALAFIALVCVLHFGASTDFTLGGVLDPAKTSGCEALLKWVFLLGFVGFGVKAAVFPLHAWLPMASVAPTPVTALLHAVAVVNTGAYAVLRLIYYSFGADFLFGSLPQMIAIGLACATVLFGSAMSVKEPHFKRRLAYSTISNLSYMLMGAALMTPAGMVGSLSHLIIHGVIKITLFYCAGAILVRSGAEYVPDLRGYGKVMPLTCAAFTLGSIALVGIPPLSGFVSKWNLLTAAAGTGLAMGIVAIGTLILSAILTAMYLFTVVSAMYFRPLNADQAAISGQNRDPNWMMMVPFGILCAAIIGLGLWSQPLVTFLRNVAAGVTF
ncbi:MAG: proton-conducting membrane transporter [Christensenellaceae bacterium]|nr:proton-conducting membrane transporter [Christensenellaceae bacterium]